MPRLDRACSQNESERVEAPSPSPSPNAKGRSSTHPPDDEKPITNAPELSPIGKESPGFAAHATGPTANANIADWAAIRHSVDQIITDLSFRRQPVYHETPTLTSPHPRDSSRLCGVQAGVAPRTYFRGAWRSGEVETRMSPVVIGLAPNRAGVSPTPRAPRLPPSLSQISLLDAVGGGGHHVCAPFMGFPSFLTGR